jgi:hypothetical protein
MNITNIPARWDLALFILGFMALLAFQRDNVFILIGVFLMSSGVILAAQPYLLNLTLRQDASDDEVKNWLFIYFASCGSALLMVISFLHIALYN